MRSLNLNTKKTVAREFIFLASSIIAGVVFFLGIYLFNFILEYQINLANDHIKIIVSRKDSITKSNNAKAENQHSFTRSYYRYFDSYPEYGANSDLWVRLFDLAAADSIAYKWNTVWESSTKSAFISTGNETPEKLQAYILDNMVLKRSRLTELNREFEKLNRGKIQNQSLLIDSDKQIELSTKCFLILIMILFGLRYFFYATKWSIKTLKES